MTLIKADLTKKLTEETELNNRDAKAFVDQFFEEIKVLLQEGQTVKLSGFGNFDLRDKR
jgi:integration host factor subunit alpha